MERNYRKASLEKRLDTWVNSPPVDLAMERLLEILRQGIDQQMLLIGYNGLCSNPRQELERYHAYLGLPYYEGHDWGIHHAAKKQSSFIPSLAPRWMNDESPQVVLTKFLRQPLLAVSPMAVMGYIRARRSTPLLRTPCSSPLRRVLRERMCSRGCGQCQAVQSIGVHLCESPNLPAERFDSSLEISTGDGQVHDVVPN